MMMTRKQKDLIKHELIGLKTSITESSDPTLVGFAGKIVGETRNTITLESNKKIRKIIKGLCVFRITVPETGNRVPISGKDLIGRPEDRTKKWK